jgi:cytidylate kinase
MRSIQIAIDGPAGAGKSTVAKKLADLLGFVYIDTGAMYRAITYKALRQGISLDNAEALTITAEDTAIQFVRTKEGRQLIFCDGREVTEEIRSPDVSENVSKIAQFSSVREVLVRKQQELASNQDVVMDGRDIGTVVLPQAECKIYLTASLEERTARRYRELLLKGYTEEYAKIRENLAQRDEMDKNRKAGPLKIAEDAVIIDTTDLTQEEVLQKILGLLGQRRGES